LDPAESLRRRRHTVAMVEEIDRQVGRILATLDEQGLRDDTIICFLTDHGEQLGDHGLWHKGPFPFENLINTPLLVAGPGIEPGVDTGLVSDIDLVPSLCRLLEVPCLAGCDGIDQSARWGGAETALRKHCLVEYRNGYSDADRAMVVLVKEDIKYMRYEDGEEECTDLAADPQERHNASKHPRIPELRAELLDRLLQSGSRLPIQTGHA
jgi:arylsulfatase A-like enzyme